MHTMLHEEMTKSPISCQQAGLDEITLSLRIVYSQTTTDNSIQSASEDPAGDGVRNSADRAPLK